MTCSSYKYLANSVEISNSFLQCRHLILMILFSPERRFPNILTKIVPVMPLLKLKLLEVISKSLDIQ